MRKLNQLLEVAFLRGVLGDALLEVGVQLAQIASGFLLAQSARDFCKRGVRGLMVVRTGVGLFNVAIQLRRQNLETWPAFAQRGPQLG
jgi:hypothetical protein